MKDSFFPPREIFVPFNTEQKNMRTVIQLILSEIKPG